MKTYEQLYREYGRPEKEFSQTYDENRKDFCSTYGDLGSREYRRPFEKLREAGIPEEYDYYISNLLMLPGHSGESCCHAYFAANVLIELNKKNLLIGHPKGIDYFYYISKEYVTPYCHSNYFQKDLTAAIELFSELIQQGFFKDNFDGLATIMDCGREDAEHRQRAKLFVKFLREFEANSERKKELSSSALIGSQVGNPVFSKKNPSDAKTDLGNRMCLIS